MALGQVKNIVPNFAPHGDPPTRAVHEDHVDPGDRQGAGAECMALRLSGRAGQGVAGTHESRGSSGPSASSSPARRSPGKHEWVSGCGLAASRGPARP